ncbi:PREDICTED: chorion peroxidase [Rhagoletis zephyria]|uniref:chorion peroxidase n=1 Tax=Rhagoletis zephyria TaxID=28612 RepID=UPI0008117D07|nr:PREDICTED: chorion peroxidase [Rhagoletis zephyria]
MEMFTGDELILPMSLSKKMHCLSFNKNKQKLEDRERNLAVVQWAQFIEHDLSKPVVTSMGDGSHIECCNKNNFELGPRHRHPFCAPLIINSGESLYGKADCLNYVRSAVAVSTKCTFGAIEQLNLATSGLDLSQLYGFTHEAQKQMRLLQKGQIKSSANGSLSEIYTDKLPKINDNAIHYCAFENYSNQTGHCFMAGDSRVNNNPLTIVIYTMFMRNHNQVAKNLASSYPLWNDEDLFQTAKAINIHIYRNIVFDEWLPIILGEDTVVKIKQGSLSKAHEEDDRVSNEFAVAAIRFYISMLPNVLNNSTGAKRLEYNTTNSSFGLTRNILPSENVISLIDQTYKPKLEYTSKKIDALIESILNQPAMKLDTIYDDSLISENLSTNRPNHNDFLAYDIQRGRDHGLRSYINYLEFHTGKKISTWTHLEPFIAMEDLNKLKSIYNDLSKIDLLVGGMAETNSFGGIVGPTFKYILAEQFSRIYQKQESLKDQLLPDLTKVSAVDFVCANSGLQRVPRNIFLFVSDKNTQKSCIDQLNPIRA